MRSFVLVSKIKTRTEEGTVVLKLLWTSIRFQFDFRILVTCTFASLNVNSLFC